MPNLTIRDIRAEAKGRGLNWPDAQAAYRDLLDAETAAQEYRDEIRRTAWGMFNSHAPGWWRIGFSRCRRGSIARGDDYTVIDGYDEIVQVIATEFPEYAGPGGDERLWEFLLSPRRGVPPRHELYARAMDQVEAGSVPACDEFEEVPF